LRFQAVLEANDATSVFVVLPPKIVAALGPRKRVPVRVTINNYTYPTTVAVYGGQSLLGFDRSQTGGDPAPAAREYAVDASRRKEVALAPISRRN
jgi:hypothetical protein